MGVERGKGVGGEDKNNSVQIGLHMVPKLLTYLTRVGLRYDYVFKAFLSGFTVQPGDKSLL